MKDPVGSMFFKASMSRVNTYLKCPKSYYYGYINKVKPQKTNLHLLMGILVHAMIQKMHDPPEESETSEYQYYFKDLEEVLKYFRGKWTKFYHASKDDLIDFSYPKAKMLGEIGETCLESYWDFLLEMDKNGRGHPIESEQNLRSFSAEHNINVVGKIDQIREIPPENIKFWNKSALDKNGNLKEGYLPYVLVDFKTGGHPYSYKGENDDDLKPVIAKFVVKKQYPLHVALQATAYTWLFEKKYGGLPLGFAFYFLRSRQVYVTFRTGEDYEGMFEKLTHVRDNLDHESYPRNEGDQCGYCVHFDRCSADKLLEPTKPIFNEGIFKLFKGSEPAPIPPEEPTQLKMDLPITDKGKIKKMKKKKSVKK